MRWSLQWGENALKIYNAAVEAGFPPPDSTVPPECPEHLLNYLQIFWTLSSCRSLGGMGGCGPIPWTAIDQYAERTGMADDELLYEDLVYFMTMMDQAYMDTMAKAAEKANNDSSGGSAGGKSEW